MSSDGPMPYTFYAENFLSRINLFSSRSLLELKYPLDLGLRSFKSLAPTLLTDECLYNELCE